VHRPDNLTTFMCRLSWNLGASTSWNPPGPSRPVMGLLYLYLYRNNRAIAFLRYQSWSIVPDWNFSSSGRQLNCGIWRLAERVLRSINSLKTKRRLLYLKTQSVPRSKHFSSLLQKPISLCCKWHKSLFVLR